MALLIDSVLVVVPAPLLVVVVIVTLLPHECERSGALNGRRKRSGRALGDLLVRDRGSNHRRHAQRRASWIIGRYGAGVVGHDGGEIAAGNGALIADLLG